MSARMLVYVSVLLCVSVSACIHVSHVSHAILCLSDCHSCMRDWQRGTELRSMGSSQLVKP